MFEKTLSDIVKGIRASKRDTALYISQCIAEIKTEINSSDMYVKANALQKLTFLQMMGYGMSWASFASIEVMSSPRFAHKRIGYIAASQGFTQDTDVILLTTNLLKKELRGAIGGSMNGVYEAGLAVNCISNIVTEELAQDLLPELTNLTQHPQPYLRKKAILCLFKVFVKYPQGLRLTFAQIQQCLSDSNPAVVSCAVNVITELSDKNPKNYLHLAPAFFDLLTTSSNNWMLIKVVKLLGSLVPEEPRLARKLLEPLADIVRNTPAKSLLYESVRAITFCLPYCRKNDGSMPASVPDIVALCAQTLRDFVEEKDQNLKYLGLVGFGSLMQSHPKVLSAPNYRPLILACLSDEDVTIRTRALDLLPGMASRKNLMELVTQLLKHVEFASGDYKLELVSKIVEMCSGEKYAMLQNFSWYLDTLFKLGRMRGLDTHADLLCSQVSDIALRVLPVRAYAVKRSIEILLEGEQGNSPSDSNIDGDNGRGKHIMPEILPSLAWIVGEYSDLFPEAVSMDKSSVHIYNDDSEGPYHSVIQAVTAPSNTVKLPASTQKVYVQAGMKVFAAAAANQQVSDAELVACLKTLWANLLVFMQSTDVEVQERAFTSHALLRSLDLEGDILGDNLPGLENADSEDDEDAEVGQAEANLLEMTGTAADISKPSKSKNLSSLPSGLASRCRSASQTMNFILKPSPMKPTSAKAQRKKHQAPSGVDIDTRSPVGLSIFSTLIEEENNHRASSRLSMEAVTFTQQRPLHIAEHVAVDAVSSQDFPPITNSRGGATGDSSGTDGTASVGRVDTLLPRSNISSRPQTSSDPFYLNSGPAMLDTDESQNIPSRFGTIMLGDGDSDDDAEVEVGKKKKKKKKKKHKASQFTSLESAPSLDQGLANVAVYGSDDDDDDDDIRLPPPNRRAAGRKGTPGKEFHGLAKVDLTMPLREDEVMPERKHHVVPERSPEAVQQFADTPTRTKEKKKKKKESKRSKKSSKHKSNATSQQSTVADLLGLGELSSPTPQATTTSMSTPPPGTLATTKGESANMVMGAQKSAINNAFDDLLGMSDSAPLPLLSGDTKLALPPPASTPDIFSTDAGIVTLPGSTAKAAGKRPWLRGTIKTSHSAGPPVVDWSKVLLNFRVYKSSADGTVAASIVIRVDNCMEMSSLDGLVLRLKDHGEIGIGDVAPGSSTESKKVGPFRYGSPDSSFDMKGTLMTGECSVSVKLSLPASMNLSPIEGLSLEDVFNQLASGQWSSNTAKVGVTSVRQEALKPMLCSFLRMAEVEAASSGPNAGTFAGQSTSGAQVRVLVKLKKASLKVDVKCTNPHLGKAIVSDLNKLVL